MSHSRTLLSGIVVALGLTGASGVQAQRPVHWRLTRVQPTRVLHTGDTLSLRVTASMQAGWYIYSLTQPPGGPYASRLTLPPEGPLQAAGEVRAPDPERHDDPNFGIVTEMYRGSVTFVVPARLTGAPARDTALVLARFQTCNDRLCLPPRTDTLRLALAARTQATTPAPATSPEREATGSSAVDQAASLPVTRVTQESAASASPASAEPYSAPSAGTPVVSSAPGALGAFLWLAAVMGLLSLLTPCVFPMVPITVGFFTREDTRGDAFPDGERERRQRSRRRRPALVAAGVYALGIVASFCALGILVTLLFGAGGVIRLAASPWLNLAVTALFLTFALNLLGIFEIKLPTGLMTRLARPSGGHGPVASLLLGAAFAVTTFTCTAPFVGTLLVLATQGSWSWPVLGLVTFSTAFATPFFLLALVPQALRRLPRSGEWMLTLRRALGVLEFAAAAKFLSNVDLVWRWGVFTRDVVVALWAAAALALALVLFGRVRSWWPPRGAPAFVRGGLTSLALVAAWWLSTGLRGARLGEVEAFLPPPSEAALASEGDLAWLLNDYPATLAQARAQARPILIDFTGYTCTNCRWMEANMFPRPGVRARLEPFVRTRLYTDGEGEPFSAQQALEARLFGTVALPVYAILTPAGKPVASFTGMTRDAGQFEAFLARGLEQARGK